MRRIFAAAASILIAAASLSAQSRIQHELLLTTQAEQKVLVHYDDLFMSPAVQVGNVIVVGYMAQPTPGPDQCAIFYLRADDPIPDQVETFMGVVVGAGVNRGYLWMEPLRPPTDCPGYEPPPGGGRK